MNSKYLYSENANKNNSRSSLLRLITITALISTLWLTGYVQAAEALTDAEFAVVNDEKISAQDYYNAFKEGIRDTFYHGKVTEKEMKEFRDSVVQKLIDETLLLQEAKRRHITPNSKQVEKKIKLKTTKYRKQKDWEESKGAIIASMRPEIEKDNVIEQLRQQIKDVPEPSIEQVKQYYQEHSDKFTAPEKWNVSIILLKVEPSSPGDVWKETMGFGEELVEKLRNGENFEELARIHSGDDSAINGGNMGYIHTGMLSKPAQNVLNTMEVGQISEPVMLLKGVAIFRLNGIQGDRLNPFDSVKGRAKDLVTRQLGDEAWKNLIIKLRENSNININEKVVKKASSGPRPQS